MANRGLIGAGDTGVENGDQKSDQGIVAEIRSSVIDGNTHYYVRLEYGVGYLDFDAAQVPRAVLLDVGDRIEYGYTLYTASFPENGIVEGNWFRFEGEESPQGPEIPQ